MENDNQNSPRIVPFLILSFLIFLGWSLAYEKLFPKPKTPPQQQQQAAATSSPTAAPTQAASTDTTQTPPAPATQAELRQIKLSSDYWNANLSNQGAVLTEWTMTKTPKGEPIDASKGGVNLISSNVTQEQGGFFRFYLPSDGALEKELNEARYAIENMPDAPLNLAKGEKREISFLYINNGVAARKRFIFKGQGVENASGYDFDFVGEVTRNGQPVEANVIIGPNFSDQAVIEYSTYQHAPQITYAVADSVSRELGSSYDTAKPTTKTLPGVTWVGVDDPYFALVFVPNQVTPTTAIAVPYKVTNRGIEEIRHHMSAAVKLNNGQVNRVYAGPKNLDTLEAMSVNFGLGGAKAGLEDIVSYGLFDYVRLRWMVKPIANFMLVALRWLNNSIQNWGWSIVVLTVLLNMVFFPLRYYSSKKMKGAAAMQPKMKALQDEMAKLSKDDPRVMELQKEQLSLMKDANPLMGCLPLLLQMPFFMAVFAILTVSIEVRHARFFGWINDLSMPDPYWLLPIIMCVTMIAQTALTPTTADPVQKRVTYIMPVILTWFFFISAPAGLVLYWMVGTLVGVVQQYVINKLTGGSTPPTAVADAAATSSTATKKREEKTGKKRSREITQTP
jgi:YidC/Oxa1 family membrane protein insertase